MLKITLEFKENKDKETCKLSLKTPKEADFEKASEIEKTCVVAMLEKIKASIDELK